MGIDPQKIINVAVTPCTAKKFEIRRDEMNDAGKYLGIDGMRDMDYVITTRELAKWAKEKNIDFVNLTDSEYDSVMGNASGAGVIFGNSGGVMEAALRTAYKFITGEDSPATLYELSSVRGMDEIKDSTLNIGGIDVNIAGVYGTKNASKMVDIIKSGEKQYHFIEVMACPGGCIGGGGQPMGTLQKGDELRKKRINGLYKRDSEMSLEQATKTKK